jgi:hypothetical protein
MTNKVEEYIEKQPKDQQKILKKLRNLILKTIPDCDKEMAWGVLAYREGKYYLAGMKERVHIGFSICGLSKKEIENFEGSGKTMRHIKIYTPNDIDKQRLIKLIKLVDQKAKCPKH